VPDASLFFLLIFFPKDTLGGNVGLAITQVLNLIGMCNWGLRQTAELENQMTSVERVAEYIEMEAETNKIQVNSESTAIQTWPTNGDISFENVSLRYSEDSEDFVLKDLTFKIKGGVRKLCGKPSFFLFKSMF
jgi:ATP-binding cassette, subfamily C (CFTR/MRP), member 4